MKKQMNRRNFLKLSSAIALASASGLSIDQILGGETVFAAEKSEQKAIVYFTREISAEGLLRVYEQIQGNVTGRVAIKWHSGEPNGPNILPVPMVKALQQSIPNSKLVETNVYYTILRKTTAGHREVLQTNGWTFFARWTSWMRTARSCCPSREAGQ